MTEQQTTPYVEEHEDEGHSKLGWICSIVMMVGFAVATVAFFLASDIGTWVGAAMIVLGAIAWPILKVAGLGPKAE